MAGGRWRVQDLALGLAAGTGLLGPLEGAS
jgi:hypothetical protein